MFESIHTWVFTALVQPLLYQFGLMSYDDQAFEGTAMFLYGLLQIILLMTLVRPFESVAPAEQWADRRGTGVDIIYTCINRLGLLPLVFFFTLQPVADALDSWLRLNGFVPPSLEDFAPPLARIPLLSFFLYMLVLDFADYVRHRFEHRFRWWWELHAVHHSQRKMSMWTDDRNHLVAEALSWLWFTIVALLIGVPPGQFTMLVVAGKMVESLSHANIRMHFGWLGDRMLVSPAYHRVHHAMGVGHQGKYYGCNFASLFPVWDILFGTANFSHTYPETGIDDQKAGRDYGTGFWSQQWLALKHLRNRG